MNIYIHHIYVLCIHVLHGCGDHVNTIKLYILYIYNIYTHALETSKFVLYMYVYIYTCY